MERAPILDQLSALADPTRSRLLRVLDGQELTVSELCSVLQLPQSTVSRHLKVLADGEWVHSRREGTRRLYRLVADELEPHANSLWKLTREQVGATPAAEEDSRRLDSVVGERRKRSREFFAGAAAEWDRLRDELFGRRMLSQGLLALVDGSWTVADLGCGTGPVAEALAPFVRRVVAVDDSPEMLESARRRLDGLSNVDLRSGELESAPIGNGEIDATTLILVLHHLPDPARVLAEVARILRPGGKLLVLDMLPHDRDEYRQRMGHIWMGFSEEQLTRLLDTAGLRISTFHALPADPDVGGPGLFVATATHRES